MIDRPDGAIVVIPVHTTRLNEHERLSLRRTFEILGHHALCIACPEGLDVSPLQEFLRLAGPCSVELRIERFEAHCFNSIESYNRLMLSPVFYARFAAYEYVLVCQTDVFVFADRLQEWCTRGYDYIGAPWIGSPRTVLNRLLFQLRNLLKRHKRSEQHLFKVGNGGFSLRKVATMRQIVEEQQADIEKFLARPNRHRHHIEDIFFSILAPRKMPQMKIPDYMEAVDFCIDRKPELALLINGGRLPFACHGFDKPKVRSYWKPIISLVACGRADVAMEQLGFSARPTRRRTSP